MNDETVLKFIFSVGGFLLLIMFLIDKAKAQNLSDPQHRARYYCKLDVRNTCDKFVHNCIEDLKAKALQEGKQDWPAYEGCAQHYLPCLTRGFAYCDRTATLEYRGYKE